MEEFSLKRLHTVRVHFYNTLKNYNDGMQISGCQRWGWWQVRETGEGGQKVETSSYKIIKSWGWNVQPDYN